MNDINIVHIKQFTQNLDCFFQVTKLDIPTTTIATRRLHCVKDELDAAPS